MHFAFLNIDKPAGVTSRVVVDRVARLVGGTKVGHCGTLDPLATGVLVLAMGPATRLASFVQRMPKQYTATFLLGRESATDDIEGEVTLRGDDPVPSTGEIVAALPRFTGAIEQRPPVYSAVKVRGRRAYRAARAGETLDLKARTVHVYRLELVRYEYPELTLAIECGGGTYVRSLGRDLASTLGTAAAMSALVRSGVGSFRLEAACKLADLNAGNLAQHLLPPATALGALPKLLVSEAEARRLRSGLSIDRDSSVGDGEVAALDAAHELVAILSCRGEKTLAPTCTFPSARNAAK